MKTVMTVAVAMLLAALSMAGSADEVIFDSRVVEVQPMTRTMREAVKVGDCAPAKPTAPDLAALLAWDLRADCRVEYETREQVTGYRVVHLVDGRRFEQVMDERPGETIAVRLRLH